MKRVGLTFIVLTSIIAFTACSESAPAEKAEAPKEVTVVENHSTVTPDSSNIVWTGSKITGGLHTGNLTIKSSEIQVKDNDLVGGEFTVDMTSLTNTDLEGEWMDKLIGHLNSDDFFSTSKFPTSHLEIVSVAPGANENSYTVQGNLTIKETTLLEQFVINKEATANGTKWTADLAIDRTKYDIKYGSSNFFEGLGDKAISDEFTLNVVITQQLAVSKSVGEKFDMYTSEMHTIYNGWDAVYQAKAFYHWLCLFLIQCEMLQEANADNNPIIT